MSAFSTEMIKYASMASFILKLVAYFIDYHALTNNAAVNLLAWFFAFRSAGKNHYPLMAALFFFPKFRLGLGRSDADEIPLSEHLFRLLAFRKVDVKLAPMIPLHEIFKIARNTGYGMWQRHRFELPVAQQIGDSRRIYMPLQRFDYTKAATLVNFISDPVDVEQVLVDRETFPTRGHTGFTDIVGEGLLGMKTGPMHASHRAMVIGFLSDTHLRTYSVVVSDQLEVLLTKWGCGLGKNNTGTPTRVNAQYDLSMLTLDIIMLTAFGANEQHLSQHIPEKDNHLAHALDVVLEDIVIRTAIPFYQYIPTPRQVYINKMIAEARQLQEKLFEDCKQRLVENPNGPVTILSEMMKTRTGEPGVGLTDHEIANELQTIRGAGHETTSNTLCWVMLLLVQNPDKLAILRKEVDQIVKGDTCTFDESKQLKYASQVVFEALRLFPTVPHFPRECHKDIRLKSSGYDVFAGSIVFVSQMAMNRSKKVWGENAEEFIPERFNSTGELRMGVPVGVPNGSKYGFAPFGAANRSCVGQRLAILEANQILGTLVKRCEWSLAFPEKPIVEVADVTLGPKKGLIFDVLPRKF